MTRNDGSRGQGTALRAVIQKGFHVGMVPRPRGPGRKARCEHVPYIFDR